MSFLKKLGQIAQVAVKLTPYGQLIAPLLPAGAQGSVAHVLDTISGVAAVVMQAEMMGQALSLPGADKLKAATPAVAQMILQSSMIAGKKIHDEALFKLGAEKVASGVADILNSLHEDEATS